MAAPTSRPIKLVVHDFEPDWDTYVERPGRTCPVDVTFAEVDPAELRGCSSSPAGARRSSSASTPTWRGSSRTSSPRRSLWARSATAPRCRRRSGSSWARSSGFGPLAPDLELAGAEYVDGAAVIDGNMVSCRGWGDLAEWSKAFLDVLDGGRPAGSLTSREASRPASADTPGFVRAAGSLAGR